MHKQPIRSYALLTLITCASLVLLPNTRQSIGTLTTSPAQVAPDAIQARLAQSYTQLPLHFEANQGKAHQAIKFQARGEGYQLFLDAQGATLALPTSPTGDAQRERTLVRLKLAHANPAPVLTGLAELPGKSNYLIGNDARQWRRGVTNYARVKASAVYPGIDLIYYGQQRQLEYDFIVQPGANPQQITLAFEGAQQMQLDADGALVLQTAHGAVRQHAPVIYQETEQGKQFITGHYQIRHQTIGFAIGEYDTSLPLVIDPVLSYASYFGDAGFEHGNAIALDAAGNIYVAGGTGSPGLMTANAVQATFGGNFDAFVLKLDPSGKRLLYATYFGGSGGDACFDLAVDAAGNAYLAGISGSPNLPVVNPVQPTYGGSTYDAFAAKLDASGTELLYATWLGGNGIDQGHAIAIDDRGSAYVTGMTASATFPTTNAFQTQRNGASDAFVVKLSPTGKTLEFATLLGGNSGEQGAGIAVDANHNVYVSGLTQSTNFPTANPLQATLKGTQDLFITKLNATGAALVYSTYLGGNGIEAQVLPGNPLSLDKAGNLYLIARTSSTDFPTVNAIQSTYGGGAADACVVKLNASGSALLYSTYLGGSGDENQSDGFILQDIALDAVGNVYVTGTTTSSNFPAANTVQATLGGGQDVFVAKLAAAGTPLLYSTYLGSSNNDNGTSLAVDAFGSVYLTGRTVSSNFQTVNPLQASYGGGSNDAIIVKLGADAVTVSAASFSPTALASKAIVAAFGPSLATGTAVASALPLPISLAGTTVRIRDSAGIERAAPLFFVSAQQVNYQIPDGTAAGPAAVTVSSGDGRVSSGVIQVLTAAPALFTANASGTGAAVALDALTFTAAPFNATQPNGQPNIIAVFGTGLGTDATDVSSDVKTDIQATLDGKPVTLLYAGSVPGAVGLNQFNLQLPIGIPTGTHTLVISRNNVTSNTVSLAIR